MLSAIPARNLLTVLKVAGATAMASASGSGDDADLPAGGLSQLHQLVRIGGRRGHADDHVEDPRPLLTIVHRHITTLGVLVDQRLAGDPDHTAGDQHLTGREVDLAPLEGDQLAAAGAQNHGQAQEQAQLRVLVHRRGEQPGHPFGVGWRDVGSAGGRWGRQLGPVVAVQPQTTACLKAPDSTVCISRTAEADTGHPRAQSGS
jgi:hypothetical protein